VLALSDGAASQRAREDGLRNLVLLDLALDYGKPTRIAISCAAGIDPRASIRALLCCSGPASRSACSADSPAWRSCAPSRCWPTKRRMRRCRAWPRGRHRSGHARRGQLPAGRWPGPTIGLAHIVAVLDNLQAPTAKNATAHLLLRRRVAEGRNFHD
jgi:3-hydroxybutyryl-CoA dehydrogenase